MVGVTGSALNKWNKHGVPPRRVPQVVAVMRGAVSYHELRPDLYPRPQADPALNRSFVNDACPQTDDAKLGAT